MNIRKAGPWDSRVYVMGFTQGNGHSMSVHFYWHWGSCKCYFIENTWESATGDSLATAAHKLSYVRFDWRFTGNSWPGQKNLSSLTEHNVFILHIPVEAILAQDILLAPGGKTDLCNSTLRLANTLLPHWAISEDAMTCKVVVSRKNDIPVWRMVSVSLSHKGYFREVGQTQPYHDAMTSKELLVIPSIVSTR